MNLGGEGSKNSLETDFAAKKWGVVLPKNCSIMLLAVPFLAFLPILLVGAFAAGVFAFKQKQRAARRAEMAALAAEHGLQFSPDDSLGLLAQLADLHLFRREKRWWGLRKGRISNVLRGQAGDGTDVFLFDYSYVVSRGKSSKEVKQTVFFAQNKNWYLPNFRLQPETWWHKVMARLGDRSDIDFDENPDFSEKFHLTAKFEDLTRELFSRPVQQFLTERPPVHMEGNNYYFLAYKPGKQLDPDEAKYYFDNCCELTQLLEREGKSELLSLVEIRKEAEKVAR